MNHKLYLEAFKCDENQDKINVTLETSIVLFTLQLIERPSNIHVFLIATNRNTSIEPAVQINRKSSDLFETLSLNTFASEVASNCSFPVIVSENVVLAGLCGVCRAIIKYADKKFKYLLGFKETCLQAPSEASPWTKFCEVDILTCVKTVLLFHQKNNGTDYEFDLPNEFGYIESHLSQPVKVHNISKLTLDLARALKINDTHSLDASSETNSMQRKTSKNIALTKCISLEHNFIEGLQISIADIILFPCFWFMQSILEKKSTKNLAKELPFTYKWIESVKNYPQILKCIDILIEPRMPQQKQQQINYIVSYTDSFTLYKRKTRRNKQKHRIFTRDDNIEQSLNKIKQFNIEISSELKDDKKNGGDFDWQLPYDALPEGGSLPENRLQRKKEQLFSLASEIIAIAKDGDRIVEFCSGQGHLAIILAYKLPRCTIFMLDNQEEMISRAKQRVQRLKLTNIRFFQCNLDYFIGDFEIGTSLHACGIASDIVLMHCRQRNANFVCCPCCYGKVIEMPHISFPRSKFFQSHNVTLDQYLSIAHCADQAHDMNNDKTNIEKSIQGQYCMDYRFTGIKIVMLLTITLTLYACNS